MKRLLMVLFFLGGLALAVYVGVFVVLMNGITDTVNGIKATPTDAHQIAWGLVQVCVLAEAVAGGILLVFWLIAGVLFMSDDGFRGRPLSRGGIPFRSSGKWPGF